MSDLILFHHVHGLTDGVLAFAERLREAGHRVTTPDLFDGVTFTTIETGVAYVAEAGMDDVIARGVAEAEPLTPDLVYAGFSLGALIAHKLAQTRPGARGALLYHHGDVPMTVFGDTWPEDVDTQIHINQHDEYLDKEVVDEFVSRVGETARVELFLYPGSTHLFTDSSLSDYEPESAELVLRRTLEFLEER
jgi:dienelactone hydrolase